MFLENAAVDHNRQSRGLGFSGGGVVDHALLHPDRGGANTNGRAYDFSPSTSDSFGFTGMIRYPCFCMYSETL